MSFLFLNIMYAVPLKKGVYEVKNHRNGGSMYVNEAGKIVLKSEPKAEVGDIKDLFTGEISMLFKKYANLFEESNEVYEKNEYGYEDYKKTYTELIPSKTDYYDLNGNKINLDHDVVAIVNENIILSNGQVVNMLLNVKYRLKEVKSESSNINYSVNKFDNKILVSEKEKIYDDRGKVHDLKSVLYVYDKSLNILKKFDGYAAYTDFETKVEEGKVRIPITHLINVEIDEYGYLDENTETSYLNGDLEIEKTNSVGNISLDFENDTDNLEATIIDGEKRIKLNDIDIKTCKRIVMGENVYYYVQTNTGSLHYIYNDKGNRVKIFNDATSKDYKVIYSDDKYVVVMNGISEAAIVLDKNFSTVNVFYPSSKSKNVTIKRILDGKYYIVNNESVYNTNFEVQFTPSSTCKVLFDKYLFEMGNNAKVLDTNLKEIKKFNKEIKYVETIDINGISFYEISGKNFTIILDSNFNELISFDKNKDNILKRGLIDNFTNGISYKYNGTSKNLAFFYDDKVCIMDINFRKIKEDKIDGNHNRHVYITAEDGNDYMTFSKDYETDYSLYKVGTGYLLKNFYFIGDLTKDHFTFVNGFYYGLMDYDLNILCQYSIFDTINDDYRQYWDEWY